MDFRRLEQYLTYEKFFVPFMMSERESLYVCVSACYDDLISSYYFIYFFPCDCRLFCCNFSSIAKSHQIQFKLFRFRSSICFYIFVFVCFIFSPVLLSVLSCFCQAEKCARTAN